MRHLLQRSRVALGRRFAMLWSDERGFALVFLAVTLPALLGLVGLTLDLGRLSGLDSELADIADAAALAAASKLDGSDNAVQKARDAGDNLRNDAALADGAKARTGIRYRFAETLADLRSSPSYSLADGAGARAFYVEATTFERSITAGFLQFVAAQPRPLRRRAIARSRRYACDVTPLALCHSDPAAFAETARRGRQYLLRMSGTTVTGSLGLLASPGETSPESTLRNLASDTPSFCHADGVAFRRDIAAASVDEAVNVRFDRYFTNVGPISPDLANYPPAPVVIQGRRYNACNSPPDAGDLNPPYRLPRDSGFATISPTTIFDAGAGDWKTNPAAGGSGSTAATALEEYLFWNHQDKGPLLLDRLRNSSSRYNLYLHELGLTEETEATPVPTRGISPAAASLPTGGPRNQSFAGLSERAVPICYQGRQEPTDARRRILHLAVVDCGALPPDSADALSRYVGKFFLTEPAQGGALLLEFQHFLTPERGDGKIRRIVELVATE